MVRSMLFFGLALLVGGGVAITLSLTPDDGALLRPGDEQVVALGGEIYAAQCASCHGSKLEGQPNWKLPGPNSRMPAPPHDETGHTWHHDDATLFGLTKDGVSSLLGPDSDYRSDMPAYADTLSDGEIIAVLSFIKSRWPGDVQARHDALNLQK